MSTQIPTRAAPAVRISVVGAGARLDLAVPGSAPVGALAEEYAAAAGLAGPPELTTAAGARLDPGATVEAAGLQHGDVLVATSHDERGPVPASAGTAAALDRQLPSSTLTVVLVAACASALGAGALVAISGGDGLRAACGAVFLLCGLVASSPLVPLTVDRARALSAAGPAFGASAGVALTFTGRPGGVLLTVTVAALLAVVVAAVGRTWLDDEHDELVDAWLVVAAAVAVVAGLMLATGASVVPLLAVVYAAAVAASRLMPYAVVDVPDQALLDLDRLAVTAWSAREQSRGSRRRRAMVQQPAVVDLVRRGQRLVAAGTVAIAAAVSVTGPLLVLRSGEDVQGIGALAMVGLGAGGLALVARSFRSVLPRVLLRASALWTAGFLGVELLRHGGAPAAWWSFAATALLAAVVVVVAVSLGRGWRSVWWARAADVAEALAIVLVVAALPLASGLFDAVRAFTS